MSLPYFSEPAAVDRLHAAWRRWEKTPFRAYSAVAGPDGGVDCVRLANCLLAEAGACPWVPAAALPFYPLDWSAHNDASMLEEWLRESLLLESVPHRRIEEAGDWLPGDVLVFSPGRSAYHLGVALTPQVFAHTMIGQAAATTRLDHPRFRAYWRYSLRILTS